MGNLYVKSINPKHVPIRYNSYFSHKEYRKYKREERGRGGGREA